MCLLWDIPLKAATSFRFLPVKGSLFSRRHRGPEGGHPLFGKVSLQIPSLRILTLPQIIEGVSCYSPPRKLKLDFWGAVPSLWIEHESPKSSYIKGCMAQFVMVIQGHKDIANPAWFPEFLDLLKVILPTSYGIQHPVNQNLRQKNSVGFFGPKKFVGCV